MYTNVGLKGLGFPMAHSLNNVKEGAVYGIESSTTRLEGMTCSIRTKIGLGQGEKPLMGWNGPICMKPNFGIKRKQAISGEKKSTENGDGSWACCGGVDEDLVALEQLISLVRRQEEGEEVDCDGD